MGVASLGTSTASTAAFTFAASVGSTWFAFFWMPCTAVDLGLARGRLTTCCTFHCGIRPLIVLSGDAVVHQSNAEDHHEAHEPGERDEEAEAGAEVGAEQHVDRAAEEPDAGDDDEDAEDRRVPQPLVEELGGEGERHVVTYRLRSYSMMASIWSFVSTAPKCGMRPDEMPRVPYASKAGTPAEIQPNKSAS